MTILLIEDHTEMADMLQSTLRELGHTVDIASDGLEGERLARDKDYDVLIVDWMLPGQDGTTLIQHLRQDDVMTPTLMLTGRSRQADEVHALDSGADDYLAKPFAFDVLYSRLNALHRRHQRARRTHTSTVGPLSLDLQRRSADLCGEPLDLRPKEFDLLLVLASEPNTVLTRTILTERIWETVHVTDDVLNTTISSLRRKLSQARRRTSETCAAAIETLRGVGYRLSVPENENA